MEVEANILKLQNPCNITVVGSTSSGKTTFVYKLLRECNDMFVEPIENILYCHSCYQPLYDEIQHNVPNVDFYEGLPSEDDILEFGTKEGHKLLILDDLMSKVCSSPVIVDLFCQFSHHKNISVIFITQNIFHGGKSTRSINLNSHYYVLFKNKRDVGQVKTLGRQLFPGKSYILMQAYNESTLNPFGYLFIDLHPKSNEKFMLRTHILPSDEEKVIFM